MEGRTKETLIGCTFVGIELRISIFIKGLKSYSCREDAGEEEK